MNVLKKRSFKHSSVSTVFTAVVIVLVILLNAVVTLLSSMYSLYVDLTSSELWTLSDTAKSIIGNAEGDITITFCQDPDYVDSVQNLKYIANTAKEIEKEFPNVHVRFVNSRLDPHLLKDYKNTADTVIRETDVIVEKGDATKRAVGEKPGEFRKYAYEAFFISDPTYGIWAYNGEEVFASACLSVTADMMPKAYFTSTHGESIGKEDISAFCDIIQLAGYNVGDFALGEFDKSKLNTIDLLNESVPDDCRLLIVNDPKYDFIGKSIDNIEKKSEIAEIAKFLETNRTLMVFKSPETDYLRNLEEYLETWGIVFGDGQVIDSANSLDMSGECIVAEYATEGTIAASLHKELSKADAPPKTIVASARPIEVAKFYTEGKTETGASTNTYEYDGANNTYREMSTVLLAPSTAVLTENGETVNTDGGYKLLTITRELNQTGNDLFFGYVMAAGTTELTSSDYLESNTYGNRDLMYYAFRVMGKEKVPAEIEFKVFANTKLENMTASESVRTAVMLITILPVAATVCGIVIITRRKYR